MTHSVRRFIGRRLLSLIPILFGIVTITFVLTRVIPGNPARLVAGALATKAQLAAVSRKLGTNTSLWHQYVHYLSGVVHGSLGTSIVTGRPVLSDLADRLPATLELISLATLVALLIGVPAGVLAARRRGRVADHMVRGVSLVFIALPDFWFGLLLLYVFFYLLGWAPAFGQIGVNDPQVHNITGAVLFDAVIQGNGPGAWAAFVHAILPVMTLGIIFAAAIARLTRSAMVETLEGDYITFARSCGCRSRTVLAYALRASLPPIITFAATIFAALVGGAVLIETVFSWGGAAQYAAGAVTQKDYPAIQGFVLASGVISVLVFLAVDLVYAAIDPRVRL